ncbi:PREDICTED: uncharacterized protein LOC18598310 [Theobroma cacao]|uniref:Uncharacterized protein LOC18598310 n=1 Tax=Theobroma cacao TaxID=3641 RepID=A0AB32WFM7_THECC|nr:PREDICTED: uncharacterized protein LOC18598310 [Theobroma cacao]
MLLILCHEPFRCHEASPLSSQAMPCESCWVLSPALPCGGCPVLSHTAKPFFSRLELCHGRGSAMLSRAVKPLFSHPKLCPTDVLPCLTLSDLSRACPFLSTNRIG